MNHKFSKESIQMSELRTATVVSGTGVALVPYDIVNFICEVQGTASSGPIAKALINDSVKELTDYYDILRSGGQTRNKRSSTSVKPFRQYNQRTEDNEFGGYVALYTLEFSTLDVSAVSSIHDHLTSIDGVSAESPSFTFLDPESHRRRALEAAWELVQERFEHQCTVLCRPRDNFRGESWTVDFRDRRDTFSKVANYATEALCAGDVSMDAEGGIARVQVTLNVTFVYQDE